MIVWLLVWLAWFVGFALSLHYLGHLPLVATLILSAALAEIISALRGKKTAVVQTFHPHYVLFRPYVGQMLIELGLLTAEEWARIFEARESTDVWSGDYLALNGRIGYALTQDGEGSTIVHWPKLDFYTTEFGFDAEIGFVQIADASSLRPWSPACFARRGRGVLEFGISVRESWWKEHQARIEAKGILKRTETIYHFDQENLIFEELPIEVFRRFYRGPENDTSYLSKALSARGWQVDDRANDEFWMQSPEKYSSPNVEVHTNFLRDAGR